jgi:hypothetical protein
VELTEDNISYLSDQGRSYDFNLAEKLKGQLLNALLETGQLAEAGEYDLDFDHQFIYFKLIRLCKLDCGFEGKEKIKTIKKRVGTLFYRYWMGFEAGRMARPCYQ